MKNLIFKSFFLMTVLFLASCAEQDLQEPDVQKIEELSADNYVFTSIDQIHDLNINEEFNIPQDVYSEFLESVVFKYGKVAGFYHGGIEPLLDDEQSEKVWNQFGFSIRKDVITIESSERILMAVPEPVTVHEDYKPLDDKDGCESAEDWDCFGSPNDRMDKAPVDGGCETLTDYICFIPNVGNN